MLKILVNNLIWNCIYVEETALPEPTGAVCNIAKDSAVAETALVRYSNALMRPLPCGNLPKLTMRVSTAVPGATEVIARTNGGDCNTGDVPNVKGTDYAKVLLDFQLVVSEIIGRYPNITVVVSSWSGLADHMMSFLKAFPNNLWISLDGSVSFQKLTYLHECAFDVPLDKLLLETSSAIPSCVANLLGRDASYHSGYWPFVVQAVAKYKSSTGITVEDVATAVSENAMKCYPKLQQCKQQ